MSVSTKIQKVKNSKSLKQAFMNEDGAIDLASIMVGIIVIGLIGGVIAATVFAVIPWAQDNAAKQQLESFNTAQSAYRGLNATTSGKFGTLADLNNNKLITLATKSGDSAVSEDGKSCISLSADGQNYTAVVVSPTGKVFTSTATNAKPAPAKPGTETCLGTVKNDGTLPSSDNGATLDTISKFTLNCATGTTTAKLPIAGFTGTVTWWDGSKETYTNGPASLQHAITPGQSSQVTLDGTFTGLTNSRAAGVSVAQMSCIRSMDAWGKDTGTTTAYRAFFNAQNLTYVATPPSTVTNMQEMFSATNAFNQNINNWNVSKVTTMNGMFSYSQAFNQPLNNWNTSNVTDMTQMFYAATAFNQNIHNWNVSKVTSYSMFNNLGVMDPSYLPSFS